LNLHKINEVVPKVGELWIHVVVISPHHKVRFFFLGIDELFVVGNKVVWVKHIGEESKALVWRLGKDFERKWLHGILNMKIKCNTVCNNFLLGLSLC
jgi:hypothetical protein